MADLNDASGLLGSFAKPEKLIIDTDPGIGEFFVLLAILLLLYLILFGFLFFSLGL